MSFEIKSLEDFVSPVKILEDSGWSMNTRSSIPHRGIRDYDRTIKFERKPSQTELAVIIEWLKKYKCPGWTGVGCRVASEHLHLYHFSTTYDSSD